ncbi:terminase small subunit [bacterium CPR1]|nr:terminase small subunit [bacterium CPR1]
MLRQKPTGGESPPAPREQVFIREYLLDCNQTQAAIRAGYSPKTASQQGSRLYARHRRAIEEALTERGQALDALRARVIEELARAAFADPRDVWTQTEDGHLRLRPLAELPPEVAGTIAELSAKQWEGGSSARARQVGKADSLKLLSKLLGMQVDRLELSGSVAVRDWAAVREGLAVKLSAVSQEIARQNLEQATQDRAAIARLEQALSELPAERRAPLVADLARWTARVDAELPAGATEEAP